ncbi:MAG: ABC transporter substrate-binding protein [Stellaceae bacterium]
MGCCETLEPPAAAAGAVGRRTVLKGLAGALSLAAVDAERQARAAAAPVKLAFCGQLLCVVPYEVTRARGHFTAEGIDMELVYTRGGNAAMQALVGGAVDYAGTSFDVAVQAYARGAKIERFASTGRLPLFALAVAPKDKGKITALKDLEGKVVGVSGLGNADHVLVLFLLSKAGADASKVRFATMGTNLYDALRIGQVDAGMVQEPALSLIAAKGGAVLVNLMETADADRYLGGAYEFMGVAVRSAERARRLDEMRRLARALAKGLDDTRTMPVEGIIDALPKALVAGGDKNALVRILARYRGSLYPGTVKIDLAAAKRVEDALLLSGSIKSATGLGHLIDPSVVEDS